MKTFDQRLSEVRGFGPGFDLVRIVLAFGVVGWHALAISEGSTIGGKEGPFWYAFYSIVPMFFALSGFLVTGSAIRLPLREYILNRVFRIVPALAVDIMLSAIILGPIFTTFLLTDYFSAPQFFSYFGNIVGWVHYSLPGVFLDNRYPNVVNGALWTVPYEIACYVVMSALIGFGLLRRSWITVGMGLGLLAASAVVGLIADEHPNRLVNFFLLQQGAKLLPFFLCGSAFYLLRAHVPFDGRIALGIVVLACVFSAVASGTVWWGSRLDGVTNLVSSIPLTYLVLYLGLSELPKPPLFSRGDYSYGVYLYHFPLLQAADHLHRFESWWLLFLVGSIPLTMVAVFSWHMIEKPILRLRRRSSMIGVKIASEEGTVEASLSTSNATTSADA